MKPLPQALAAFREKIETTIKENGHATIMTGFETEAGMISMVYTVGLGDGRLPEIITFGVPHDTAQSLLSRAAHLLRAGKLPLDQPVEAIGGAPMVLKEVHPGAAKGVLNVANQRAQEPVAALQLIWPDEEGLFPWEAGFDESLRHLQPNLYDEPQTPEDSESQVAPGYLH